MTNIWDFGEQPRLWVQYYDPGGTPTDPETVTITVVRSDDVESVTDTAMTQYATGVYYYDYTIPITGPSGIYQYITKGTSLTGKLIVQSGIFEVVSRDLSYTTPENVRLLVPDILIADEDLGAVTGSTATLKNPAVYVSRLLRDTTQLLPSYGYTFTRPREISLVSPATGENFIATCHRTITDENLEKIIDRSDRIIKDEFENKVQPSRSYLNDWSAYLSASLFLRTYAKGDSDILKWADSYEKTARDGMQAYKKNTSIGTWDDTAVTRSDATPNFELDQQDTKDYD